MHSPDALNEDQRRRRPARWLGAWIVGSVLVAGVAFAAGSALSSPWDDAVSNATTQPQITATVEKRTLQPQMVVALGTVAIGSTFSVVPVSTDQLVVTGTAASVGTMVKPGDELVEVSGRPIIALSLPFSLYRDILPGDSGRDVEAVQRALGDLGLYSGAVDGDFGPRTSAAVRTLYERVGAPAPASSAEARSAVDDAVTAKTQAQAEGADASTLADAQIAIDAARAAAETPLPQSEIVAVPAGGATVVSALSVGQRIGEEEPAVAVLRTGVPSATARVGVADAESFARGATVDVVEVSDASRTATGTISAVSDFKAADDVSDLPGYDVTVTFDEKPVFDDGARVQLIPQGTGTAIEGLAVPAVALREDRDQAYVLVENESGAERRVDVTVVVTADGYSLVEGVGIDVGTTVVVGVS